MVEIIMIMTILCALFGPHDGSVLVLFAVVFVTMALRYDPWL